MLSVVGKHDVGRLQVAMRDTGSMHIVEGIEKLGGNTLPAISRGGAKQLGKWLTVDKFENNAFAYGYSLALTVCVICYILHTRTTHDTGMLQLHKDLHFLT